MELKQIQTLYDQKASWYELTSKFINLVGLGRLRRKVFSQARGKILEIGAGTGNNLPFFPKNADLTLSDLSSEMLNIAQTLAKRLRLEVKFVRADAQNLPFEDFEFDTVCSSLSTCTFIDPVAVLKEMRRLTKPGGQILLLEHGRSRNRWLGRWQDRFAPKHYKKHACRLTQDPTKYLQPAGLVTETSSRHFFGIFYAITAKV